eukprot:6196885-Pleurochrysis_carterae.AAC.4
MAGGFVMLGEADLQVQRDVQRVARRADAHATGCALRAARRANRYVPLGHARANRSRVLQSPVRECAPRSTRAVSQRAPSRPHAVRAPSPVVAVENAVKSSRAECEESAWQKVEVCTRAELRQHRRNSSISSFICLPSVSVCCGPEEREQESAFPELAWHLRSEAFLRALHDESEQLVPRALRQRVPRDDARDRGNARAHKALGLSLQLA